MDNFDKNINSNNNDKNNLYFGFADEKEEQRESEEDNVNNDVEYEIVAEDYPRKRKKGKFKKVFGFLAGGVVCALLGGVIGSFSTAKYVMNNYEGKRPTGVVNNTPEIQAVGGALTGPQIVEKVGPAVVGVAVKSVGRDPFYNLQEQQGIGSGFIISEDGLVLTNYHVINGAQEVKVILYDGTEVNAKVVNYDSTGDMAVLKITDDIEVPGIVELGDSSTVQAAEEVIAIGNPLGKEFSQTITKGIVSSPNRKLSTDGVNIVEYIQTDAAINPGNSGGPLINSKGQVIGINTAKKVGAEIEGIGFAIPIDKVKDRLDALSKPILKLGITARDVDEATAKANGLEEGIYVVAIEEFSVAEKAGLRIGDLIIEFGGERVKATAELNKLKEKYNEGDTVDMTIIRDGNRQKLQVKLAS